MKPGDKVWVSQTVIDDPFMNLVEDVIWVEETTGKQVFVREGDYMPAVPDLPQIARFLAAHLETVEALVYAVDTLNTFANSHDQAVRERSKHALNTMSGLLRAMRGEDVSE